jgi:anionic cell wall polymer biosynthesis LytR-Cps2A-Psr (LCP) family protein
MKKKVKWLVLIICLIVFASIVSGRGSSSSEETKQVVTNDQADTADNEMESAESDNDGGQSP